MKKQLIIVIHLMIGSVLGSEVIKTLRPTLNPRPIGINNSCCDDSQEYNLLYEILNAINNNKPQPTYCNYIPVFGPMTITSSGAYCLNNSVQGTITIASSNVMLDLNSYSVGNTTGSGVVINQGFANVTIKNGSIQATTKQGLIINQNCSAIDLHNLLLKQTMAEGLLVNQSCDTLIFENITLNQCGITAQYAVNINGSLSAPVNNLFFNNIAITGSTGGIRSDNANNILIKNSSVTNSTNNSTSGCSGIMIQADAQGKVANLIIKDCAIEGVSAQNGPARGISLSKINNVYLDNCVVGQITGEFSSGYNIFEVSQIVLDNCYAAQIIDNNTLFTGDGAKGCYTQNCANVLIKNLNVLNISSAYGYAYGIQAVNSPQTVIKNATCTNVSSLNGPLYQGYNFGPSYAQAPRSFGVEINQSPYSTVEHSFCSNIFTNGIAAFGFHIDNCPFSIIHQCRADTLNAAQASWAFRVFEGSNNVILDHCTSLNLTVTSAPFLSNLLEGAVGFEIDSVQNIYLKDCVSTINTALSAGGRAAGLTISSPDYTHNIMVDTFYTSSSVAITPTQANGIQLSAYSDSCTFKDCVSKDNSGSGIYTNAPNTVIYDSQFSNCAIGIANYSTSSTIHDTIMTNCGIGLYNNAAGSVIYNCSATQNTTNYSTNVPNVVTLGGIPIAGNNLSDQMASNPTNNSIFLQLP